MTLTTTISTPPAPAELHSVSIGFASTVVFPAELHSVSMGFESTVIPKPAAEVVWAEASDEQTVPNLGGMAAEISFQSKFIGAELKIQSPVVFPGSILGAELRLDPDLILLPPTVINPIPDLEIRAQSLLDYVFAADTFFDDPRRSTPPAIGDFTYTATLSDGSPLPSWLTFMPASRRFVGTPTINDIGTIEVRVKADVGANGFVYDFFNIVVVPNFFEPLFPENLSYGTKGGPGFNTNVIELDSGAEQRVARWTAARRRYNAAYTIRNQNDLSQLINFYLSVRGARDVFRVKDWSDYTSSIDPDNIHTGVITPFDHVIGVGDGVTKQFQLIKRYTNGVTEVVRNITQPIGGTVRIGVNGVEVPEAVSTGWSVDTSTGIITFTIAPPDGEDVTGGFGFHVPCRFGQSADALLDITIDSFKTASTNVPLIEVRNETQINEDYIYGGANTLVIESDIQLSVNGGRVLNISSGDVTDLEVILPPVNDLLPGGPYFWIRNTGINFLRIVAEQDAPTGEELSNLQENETITVVLGLDDSGNKEWIAIK